jgi:hypothetical protein
MCSALNFKIIDLKIQRESTHLYHYNDKCLYKKNGKKKYYICIGKNAISGESCQASGKIENGRFIRINQQKNRHQHENHEIQAQVEEVYRDIKQDVAASSTPISQVFHKHTNK